MNRLNTTTVRRLCTLLVATWAATWGASTTLAAPATAAAATAAAPAIGPWLAKHCGDCHTGGSKEGGVSLEGVAAFKDAKPDVWSAVHEQLQLGLMPPADAEQPSAEERAAIIAWLTGSMRAAGQLVTDKLALPNYGNYVPHEPLFRGPAHPAPATVVRAWRLRPDVYDKRVPTGTQPFSLLTGQQVSDFASLYEIDESAAEVVLSNAQAMVERWTAATVKDGKPVPAAGADPKLVELLDPQVDLAAGKLDAAISSVADKALNRPLSPKEREKVLALYAKVLAENGRERAVRTALAAPFLFPDAYYRLEIGVGDPDEHGRRRLPKQSLVEAIQQTLFGVLRPHQLAMVLRNKDATLGTREEVAALVREMLDDQRLLGTAKAAPQVLRFFDEYFDYRKATGIFKEVPQPLAYDPTRLVGEASTLIGRILAEDRDVFRRLLTTREAFVGQGSFNATYSVYGLPPDSKADGLVTLDPVARCGFLTQPAWLVAQSGNFDNDPVRRGKWVLEHLLGGTVPDIPITVCAMIPSDPNLTLRQRFRRVSDDSYCWKCHHRMNQLGMAFETYDHFGRYRMRDEQDNPVDASGAVVDSGVPELDGPVQNAVELIERLAKSQRAEEMFVRYAFRFFLGRNETLRDAKTLREAHDAYVTSEGSMKALVTSLLASDSFVYRVEQ